MMCTKFLLEFKKSTQNVSSLQLERHKNTFVLPPLSLSLQKLLSLTTSLSGAACKYERYHQLGPQPLTLSLYLKNLFKKKLFLCSLFFSFSRTPDPPSILSLKQNPSRILSLKRNPSQIFPISLKNWLKITYLLNSQPDTKQIAIWV